jgi:hypothetical protein
MSTAVTTRSYSNLRDGANLAETVLTSLHVQKSGISHLGDLPLEDVRGTECQPLFVPGLTMHDGSRHDCVFTADMSNNVYCFDANTFKQLWKQTLGHPVVVDKTLDMYLINPSWGILGTPVINVSTKTLYVVVFSSPDGKIADNAYHLHCLSLIDGSAQAPKLALNGATYQPPGGLPKFTLGQVPRKQRPGLVFDSRNGHDTVFIAFGSFAESAPTNQGWVIAVDVTGLKPSIAAAWTSSAKFEGGGIWMGGQGLSMDHNGFLHGMTGNGAFSPPTDFGECFFKLQYTPKTATKAASLNCVDWWSPFSDTGRVGDDPTLAHPSLIAGRARPTGTTNASSNMNGADDEDLGSGGPLLVPASITGFTKDCIIGAGKDGIAYVLDMNNMGKTQNADFAPGKIAGNYAKLLSPPYGFTYFPAGIDIAPTDLSTIPTQFGGYTHHQHSTPVCYKSPDHGFMLFTQGENGPVRAFRLNADFTITYLATGNEVASAGMLAPGGMPGGMMTLSANGTKPDTAVLWVLMPLNDDANKRIVQGRLVAYGANWIAPGGQLVKIWDSLDWNIVFKHNKFNVPTCANGKVFVPTYDGRIMVFG